MQIGRALPASLALADEAATQALGARLAGLLTPGSAALLTGPLGAGKSTLARAFIRARLAAAGLPDEAIPSPSFTLVQTYDQLTPPVWHLDLWRLGSPEEIWTLGVGESGPAVLLIEWGERLPPAFRPADRLEIGLDHDGDGRRARLAGFGRCADLLAPADRKAMDCKAQD